MHKWIALVMLAAVVGCSAGPDGAGGDGGMGLAQTQGDTCNRGSVCRDPDSGAWDLFVWDCMDGDTPPQSAGACTAIQGGVWCCSN